MKLTRAGGMEFAADTAARIRAVLQQHLRAEERSIEREIKILQNKKLGSSQFDQRAKFADNKTIEMLQQRLAFVRRRWSNPVGDPLAGYSRDGIEGEILGLKRIQGITKIEMRGNVLVGTTNEIELDLWNFGPYEIRFPIDAKDARAIDFIPLWAKEGETCRHPHHRAARKEDGTLEAHTCWYQFSGIMDDKVRSRELAQVMAFCRLFVGTYNSKSPLVPMHSITFKRLR